MKEPTEKLSKLESALLVVMQAIDNQVAREMQRTPAAEELQGVLKWAPYEKRIEQLTGFILGSVAERTVDLDSLLVLSQASAKALSLYVQELGEEGLGKVRSEYCLKALKAIGRDSGAAETINSGGSEEN